MKKEDLKVLGAFVFAGSASIGVMNNGVKPTHILELVDGMTEDNAMQFVHNYPEIPVVEPSVWEKPGYLEKLREEKYDFLYGNPPCSGLSLGAPGGQSVEKGPNCHMYRFLDIVDKVEPKAWMFENAPTLVSTGKPILADYVKRLGHKYNFTVIRDYGKNHGLCMKRQRTFFIGWRKDQFAKIPTVHMDKQPETTCMDILGDLVDVPLGSFLNHELLEDRPFQDVEKFIKDLPKDTKGGRLTINWVICNEYEKYEPYLTERYKKAIKTQLWKQRAGVGYWDKSTQRINPEGLAPSLTGYSTFAHPTLDRQLTLREYARLMGFPDDFEVLHAKTGKDTIRHLAQGVPVKYFQWASGEVIEALLGNRTSLTEHFDTQIVVQQHIKKTMTEFTAEEFYAEPKICDVSNKEFIKTKQQELTV